MSRKAEERQCRQDWADIQFKNVNVTDMEQAEEVVVGSRVGAST